MLGLCATLNRLAHTLENLALRRWNVCGVRKKGAVTELAWWQGKGRAWVFPPHPCHSQPLLRSFLNRDYHASNSRVNPCPYMALHTWIPEASSLWSLCSEFVQFVLQSQDWAPYTRPSPPVYTRGTRSFVLCCNPPLLHPRVALGLPTILQLLKVCILIDPACLLSCRVDFLNLNELFM